MNKAGNKDKKILLIEEDEQLKKLLQMELIYNNFQVESSLQKGNMLTHVQSLNPEVIIINLDQKIDDSSAISFCEKLRFHGNTAWIITLSARSNISERIQALNAGADDCFVKPFSTDELAAKVRAMLRRSSSDKKEGVLQYSDLKMDLINRTVWRNNTLIDLRAKEFDLLKVFLLKPEEVLNREFIFDQVWGSNFLGDSNVIEVYIRYLRSKLGKPHLIKTKRGDGYVLISEEAQISRNTSALDI